MAKKGFKFSKDLLFLMGGLMIVLGILFYVIGYKVREGFYETTKLTTQEKAAAKALLAKATAAAVKASTSWSTLSSDFKEKAYKIQAAGWVAGLNQWEVTGPNGTSTPMTLASERATDAATAWNTASSSGTKADADTANSKSTTAQTACSTAGESCSAAITTTAAAVTAFNAI